MSEYKDYGYDNAKPSQTHFYLSEPILNYLADKKDRYILDIGCGNGALARTLLEHGYDVYGTDASEKGIAIARQHHPERFALQDISSDGLPAALRDIPFDTVISTEVIEHLYDPKKFIRFAKKIFEDRGYGEIILSTPYHGYLKNLLLSLTDSWDNHINPLWDGGLIKFWSKKTLSKLLTDEGFEIIRFIGCGRVPYLWKSMIIIARYKR